MASPFPQVLADEVDRLSALEDSTARLELLQKVTGELTGADSVQDIARTVADNAVLFSGRRDRTGLRRHAAAARCARSPGAARVSTPRWPRSTTRSRSTPTWPARGSPVRAPRCSCAPSSRSTRPSPTSSGYYPTERSLHIVPLLVGDHVLGLLATTFAGGQLTEDIETAFMQSLADALAQALERAQALDGSARGQRPDGLRRRRLGRAVGQPRLRRHPRRR